MKNIFNTSSSDETKGFYEGLMKGQNKRGIWGKESRFDPAAISSKPSVLKHFAPVAARYLSKQHRCLDLGCGPGGFLAVMADMCGSIVGADIVPSFVQECQQMIEHRKIGNARAVLLDSSRLAFADNEFDRVIMVDTIHHLENMNETMSEVARVLKPGGMLLIFEPNKLNPLLALMCVLDKNEHGLLKLGTFSAYKKLLGNAFAIECEEYNGTLIGPDGGAALAIADYLAANRILSWLSPKLFIAARKI